MVHEFESFPCIIGNFGVVYTSSIIPYVIFSQGKTNIAGPL